MVETDLIKIGSIFMFKIGSIFEKIGGLGQAPPGDGGVDMGIRVRKMLISKQNHTS